jgi:hypothetical protein
VQQFVAGPLEFIACRRDRVGVRHLELDGCLGDHPAGGPLRRAEAGLCRLREWPDTKVLAAGDAPAGVVALTFALQWEAEGIHEQLAALRRVGGDHRHARDEENVHVSPGYGARD